MAGEDRRQTDTVIGMLAAEPYAFDFFQAVRLLECSLAGGGRRVGYSDRPVEDPIRFCQKPSLAFPPSTLASCHPAHGGVPAKLFVNFFGLLGPNGPMPLHFTEYVRSRQLHHGDETLARFLDMFHHRMISFFYRAWAAGQQTVNYEGTGEADRFSVYMGSLFGLGMSALRGRDEVSDVAKLHYAGRLTCQTRSADGLEAVLEDYYKVPARIRQFVGRWMDLPPDCRCRLGESARTGLVGLTAIVGSRIWECQQKFRIILGPMDLAAYVRFLPGEKSFDRLCAWVRLYVGEELDWDVRLILKARDVPRMCLGREGRLGWTTWLFSGAAENDVGDLVLRPFGFRTYRRVG